MPLQSLALRAIEDGDVKTLKKLIHQESSVLLDTPQESSSLLHEAAAIGTVDLVLALLSHPATQVNHLDRYNNTPLHVACDRNNAEIVAALLACEKVDAAAINKANQTPLILACCKGSSHVDVVRAMIYHPRVDPNIEINKISGLQIGCMQGLLAIVGEFAGCPRVDINKVTTKGTALSIAIRYGHQAIVKLLLSKPHLNPSMVSAGGKSPLLFACNVHNQTMIHLLSLDLRVNLNAPDDTGLTPAMVLVRDNRPRALVVLLSTGRVDRNSLPSRESSPSDIIFSILEDFETKNLKDFCSDYQHRTKAQMERHHRRAPESSVVLVSIPEGPGLIQAIPVSDPKITLKRTRSHSHNHSPTTQVSDSDDGSDWEQPELKRQKESKRGRPPHTEEESFEPGCEDEEVLDVEIDFSDQSEKDAARPPTLAGESRPFPWTEKELEEAIIIDGYVFLEYATADETGAMIT